MKWKIVYTDRFIKEFDSLDRPIQQMVRNWVRKHLEETIDPRIFGKALTGNLKGYWRYRIGDYRLVVEIKDYMVIIRFVSVGHRKDIYK